MPTARSLAFSLSHSLAGVLRFLLPWACAGCRRPMTSLEDEGFCGRCWLALPRLQGWVCRFCGVPLADGGNLCFTCRQEPAKILIRAAVAYRGPVLRAVHRFKYAGRKTLCRPFAILMECAWAGHPELHPVDALVPVPLHASSRWERGYNQAEILARALSSAVGVPIMSQALIRTRKTIPQFQLRKTERLTNLRGAFAVSRQARVKGMRLMLIDDVCTTGATLQECARALRRTGAARVHALVLARD